MGDMYSKHICKTCWQIVENFHAYYTRVYETQSKFHVEEPIVAQAIKVESHDQLDDEIDNSCTSIADNTETNFDVQLPDDSIVAQATTFTNRNDSTEEDACTEMTIPTEVANTNKPALSMPKTFDEQVLTEDIFKRFKTM